MFGHYAYILFKNGTIVIGLKSLNKAKYAEIAKMIQFTEPERNRNVTGKNQLNNVQ